MGVSALFLSTGLVAFLIAGYRGVVRARGQRKPTDLPLIVIAIALGLAFVFLAPRPRHSKASLYPVSAGCCLMSARWSRPLGAST